MRHSALGSLFALIVSCAVLTLLMGRIGFAAVWAAAVGIVAYESVSRVVVLLLQGLGPRTEAEAKHLRRVGNDILQRQREKQLADAVAAHRAERSV